MAAEAPRKVVMISSTARDLPQHREQVRLACTRAGFDQVEMMEHLTALNENAVQASLRMVERADVYLGILAHRYGTIPTAYDLSITEMEYNRAVELDKPRLIFFIHDDHPVRAADFDTGVGAEKLKALKTRIGEDRVAAFFKSPEDLRSHIVEALTALSKELDAAAGKGEAARGSFSGVDEPALTLSHPRVEDLFVGRAAERERLAAAVFPEAGMRRPAVVSGMAGVGKSYLVDRVYWEKSERFLGGYVRLALDPANPGTAAELLAQLRDRLKLPAGDAAALAARLAMPLTLVHIENADNHYAGRVVGEFAAALPGCAIVVSARFRDLGFGAGWAQVPLLPFDEPTSLEQLQAELGADALGQQDWPALAAALGHLPLALHLAAGHLRAGRRAEAFLRRLRDRGLALEAADPADPTFRERSRALLSDTFDLSLDALRREGGADGEAWLAGLAALGHAPATGFGASLGAAIAGLSPETFEDMALAAARLSLLDRVPRDAGSAFRLHPLLAELLRVRTDKDAAFAHMTEWFVDRLPQGGDDQGNRWREINEETAALTDWLGQIPPSGRVRVERAGSRYAIQNGPFHAWLRFCEEALAGEVADNERSNFLWTLGQVALSGGLPDRALAAAEQKRDLDRAREDERETALAASLIADILQVRGQLDDALKIRHEEQLPVYERLGDVRSRAVTMGKIADILQARGQLDEALQLRMEETPIYEQLGAARDLLVARTEQAMTRLLRGAEGDRDEARRLLGLALGEARRLKLPEAQQIEQIIEQAGLS